MHAESRWIAARVSAEARRIAADGGSQGRLRRVEALPGETFLKDLPVQGEVRHFQSNLSLAKGRICRRSRSGA